MKNSVEKVLEEGVPGGPAASRLFWGSQTPEGECKAETAFNYEEAKSLKLEDLLVPSGSNCLAVKKSKV